MAITVDLLAALLPVAFMYSTPWLTYSGFTPWPPPMPIDYPPDTVVTKSSLSGYIETPEATAALGACFFFPIMDMWRFGGQLPTKGARNGSVSCIRALGPRLGLLYFQVR